MATPSKRKLRKDSSPRQCSETPSLKRQGRMTRSAATGKAINYDMKYHPMDDVMRPLAAAARKAAYGLDSPLSSTASVSTLVNRFDQSDDEMEDVSLPSPNASSPALDAPANSLNRHVSLKSGTSHSPLKRRVTRGDLDGERPVQYNMKYHPMDDVMRPNAAKKVLARSAAMKSRVTASAHRTTTSPPSKIPASRVWTPTTAEKDPVDQLVGNANPVALASLKDSDRLVYELQKGVSPDSDMFPLTWSEVAKALEREYGVSETLFDLGRLRRRYGVVFTALRDYYHTKSEPEKDEIEIVYFAEDFGVLDYDAGERYWMRGKDSVVTSGNLRNPVLNFGEPVGETSPDTSLGGGSKIQKNTTVEEGGNGNGIRVDDYEDDAVYVPDSTDEDLPMGDGGESSDLAGDARGG
ncbi:MAG: hypothetical protein L6R40_003965 [Gallowayella cf. fulva]|nr:MAG: hypothetical protein L6R40_003965 [Xanthomendoza cf. fulva]